MFQRTFTRPTITLQPLTILDSNRWCPDELDAIQEQAIIKLDAEIQARESAVAAVFETEVAFANHQRPILRDLVDLSTVLN